MRGKLIFLFGIDGSGKSTILRMLENSGLDNTVYTSCGTNAVFEEELYQAECKLHFSRGDVFSHEFKHLLHIGSVIYKMFDMILPLLDNGRNVILDRYVICIKLFTDLFLNSSYSCLSRALDCLPVPDLGIYLDVDIGIAIQRIAERSRRTGTQPHYSESMESLIKKKAGYEAMIPNEKHPILRVDAEQIVDKVYSSVLKILNEVCAPHSTANQVFI